MNLNDFALFDTIKKAANYHDINATIAIIERYMPLILRNAMKEYSREIDEDLLQTILAGLSEKIPGFKIKVS